MSTLKIEQAMDEPKKNEVIVLGTIHSGHFEYKSYSLQVLRRIITEIDPDLLFAEIPPDRLPIALEQWKQNSIILESRVSQFPEYSEVIIPLSEKLKFEIIPTSAWTAALSKTREKKLDEIYQNPARSSDVKAYQDAVRKTNEILGKAADEYDPFIVNSAPFDDAIDIQMTAFENAFGRDLGKGGWEKMNQAHFALMEKALDKYAGQGKRILITFGAGHKGWLQRALRKRSDVVLKELTAVVTP